MTDEVIEVEFPEADVPSSLYNLVTGESAWPTLRVRPPDNDSLNGKFPSLVDVPGGLGGPEGNIRNVQKIAGGKSSAIK